MQFEGQWPKREQRSYARGSRGTPPLPSRGGKFWKLKEGIWEPPDAIYDITAMLWRYFHENN